MTRIVAFPPVGILSRAPEVVRPVSRSQSLFSGQRHVSTAGPARRVTKLVVSALAMGRAGAGYMDQLWREIDGGVDLVRLSICGPNWVRDTLAGRAAYGTAPLSWQTGSDPLAWQTGGDPLAWYTGLALVATAGTDALGYATISLTGLPPDTLIVRAGDVIRAWGGSGGTARAVTSATTDGAGAVTIRLDATLPAGIVSLHDAESVVFEVLSYQPGTQGVSGDWTAALDLREVLASEIADPEDVNPW